jgi:hypothetical protein
LKNFILSLLVSSLSTSAFAWTPDGQETNGGDPFVAEFLVSLDSVLGPLPLTLPLENGAHIQREVLENARVAVVYSSEETLTIDGREVAAVNQPLAIPPRIVVSRSAWKGLNENQKSLLVIHELLPIVGIFDEHYKNSLGLHKLLQPDNSITVSSLETAIDQCNQDVIIKVSEQSFKRLISQPQIEALTLRALDNECPAWINKMKDWYVNMDLCIGSISLTNWFLRSAIQNDSNAIQILQTLRTQGVPTYKVCANKVNNSCEMVKKTGSQRTSELSAAMGCP